MGLDSMWREIEGTGLMVFDNGNGTFTFQGQCGSKHTMDLLGIKRFVIWSKRLLDQDIDKQIKDLEAQITKLRETKKSYL